VQVIERLNKVLRAATPALQLRDEDGVDLSRLGEGHHLFALSAVVLGTGESLFLNTAIRWPAGERPKIAFLGLARLVVGANAAVWRVSQFNPQNCPASNVANTGIPLWQIQRSAKVAEAISTIDVVPASLFPCMERRNASVGYSIVIPRGQ
jgi:hypothetical protein